MLEAISDTRIGTVVNAGRLEILQSGTLASSAERQNQTTPLLRSQNMTGTVLNAEQLAFLVLEPLASNATRQSRRMHLQVPVKSDERVSGPRTGTARSAAQQAALVVNQRASNAAHRTQTATNGQSKSEDSATGTALLVARLGSLEAKQIASNAEPTNRRQMRKTRKRRKKTRAASATKALTKKPEVATKKVSVQKTKKVWSPW